MDISKIASIMGKKGGRKSVESRFKNLTPEQISMKMKSVRNKTMEIKLDKNAVETGVVSFDKDSNLMLFLDEKAPGELKFVAKLSDNSWKPAFAYPERIFGGNGQVIAGKNLEKLRAERDEYFMNTKIDKKWFQENAV